jgi:putative ABC transport system permease protein
MVGLFIGIFAILVGMVSVANIMFVSVKERTNIIGIKKALGAKQTVILLEFLGESIILCIIGGVIGLGLVFLVLKALTSVLPFAVYLAWDNIIFGVAISVIVGVLSGFIPALQASRMDPVVAIRQGG